MSRTIWPSIALMMAAIAYPVQVLGEDQPFDYQAALSSYLDSSTVERGFVPNLNHQSPVQAQTTTMALPMRVMPTGSRLSELPTAVANPVQAATAGNMRQFGSVTTVSGAADANGTTTATNRLQNIPLAQVPEAITPVPQIDAEMAAAQPTFLGTNPVARNVLEQDGARYYMEPTYENAPVAGGVPFVEGTICEEPSCQQCCASLCGCRPCQSPLWLQSELLLWGVKGQYVPDLLTRSPAGTPATDIGVLGLPTTDTIFGRDRISDDLRIGGRVRGGIWLNECRKYGLEADFFYLGDDDDNIRATSDAGDLFARPFYNTNPAVMAQDAELLVAPNIASSVFQIDSSSQIYSVAPNFRWNLYCCESTNCCCEQNSTRLDFLVGYRYFRFREAITLSESFEPAGAFYVPGTTIEFHDAYEVENNFNGAELGLNYMTQRCRWVLDMTAKLGLGNVRSTCSIDGHSRVVVPGIFDQTMTGGFLTAGSRLGTFESDSFAVLPQAEVRLGYCVMSSLRFHVGYNFMFLDNVVRPGSLISTQVDSDDFLVDATPAADDLGPDKDAIEQGVWLQGVNFGFTYNF